MDFWFPWSCAVCRTGFEGRSGPLCAKCYGALRKLEDEPSCPVCAASLPMPGSPCPYCKGKGWPNFERVVRLTSYHDPVGAMIRHMKYHRGWGLGEELAKRLLLQERVNAVLRQTQVLVPVPLHWRRQLERGYNQAEVIARCLGTAGPRRIPVARPVRRVRNTETQTHLHSHAKRARNLRDAFALVDGRRIAGRHVTLVDDVWTTGATMQAMARVLKTARPASISAIVVAAADPRGVERGPEGRRVAGVGVDEVGGSQI
jgi:ComF family protein